MGYLHVEKREEKKLFESYKTKTKVLHAILFAVLLVIGIAMIMPFIWTLSSSFKNNNEIFSYPIKWIPEVFRWSNYEEVWSRIPFLLYYVNTIKLSVIVTVGQIITCSLAAYSFSKLHYPGRDKIFLCYLATMMVPWHAIMIPQFIIVKSMGLYDSHWSLIVINLFSAFGVFLLRQFMLGIPEELSEAARIDGLSEVGIFFRMFIPTMKSTYAAAIIITFMGAWNNYLWPKVILQNKDAITMPMLVSNLLSGYTVDYGMLMLGVFICTIPTAIIFFAFQKSFTEGITGAVK